MDCSNAWRVFLCVQVALADRVLAVCISTKWINEAAPTSNLPNQPLFHLFRISTCLDLLPKDQFCLWLSVCVFFFYNAFPHSITLEWLSHPTANTAQTQNYIYKPSQQSSHTRLASTHRRAATILCYMMALSMCIPFLIIITCYIARLGGYSTNDDSTEKHKARGYIWCVIKSFGWKGI